MTNTYIPYYGAYSFMDVQAVMDGPGMSSLNIGGPQQIAGPNSGSAEEGVTITLGEETNTQTIGADGSVMNSLHASRAGTATFRLLKTSPVNRSLMLVYNYQRQQSTLWGRNTITVKDIGRGDDYVLQGCAFVRFPTNSYAKVGNTIEWEFHVSLCNAYFGSPEALNVAGQGGYNNMLNITPASMDFGALQVPPRATPLTRVAPGRLRDELSWAGRG